MATPKVSAMKWSAASRGSGTSSSPALARAASRSPTASSGALAIARSSLGGRWSDSVWPRRCSVAYSAELSMSVAILMENVTSASSSSPASVRSVSVSSRVRWIVVISDWPMFSTTACSRVCLSPK